MNCLSKEELVDCLFSGDRFAPAAAKEHLSACAACREKLETLKRLRTAAASVPPSPVSADFTARLMRGLRTEAPAAAAPVVRGFFGTVLRPAWGFGLAAFAVAVYAGVVFLSGHRAPRALAAEALQFSDGPATVNSGFAAPEREGFVYTDDCAAARCGL